MVCFGINLRYKASRLDITNSQIASPIKTTAGFAYCEEVLKTLAWIQGVPQR